MKSRQSHPPPAPRHPQARRDATTLDLVHAAMPLQDTGHSQALRDLIVSEREQGSDFLRLANALSALYPTQQRRKVPVRCDAAGGAAVGDDGKGSKSRQ